MFIINNNNNNFNISWNSYKNKIRAFLKLGSNIAKKAVETLHLRLGHNT